MLQDSVREPIGSYTLFWVYLGINRMISRHDFQSKAENYRVRRRYKPNGREAALLLLRLIEAKDSGADRPRTRARLAEITLKRLWNRNRLEEQFLAEVSEWLLTAGWALLFAGSTYGAVRTSVVENWSPISSKHIQGELDTVAAGQFDFVKLEHLLDGPREDDQIDEDAK